MKGQIFTLDAFLSVLLFTVMLGIFVIQFERVESSASNLNYLELQTLANDWSQIAVKNLLVKNNYTMEINSDLTLLNAQMAAAIKLPFAYEVNLTNNNYTESTPDCTGMQNSAVATRLVNVNGAQQNLTVKICA